MSLMVNSLSAINDIPGLSSMQFKSPDTHVHSASATYSGEIEDTQPLGVHPIKNLAVLWCL